MLVSLMVSSALPALPLAAATKLSGFVGSGVCACTFTANTNKHKAII
jgi:hypothetical protein